MRTQGEPVRVSVRHCLTWRRLEDELQVLLLVLIAFSCPGAEGAQPDDLDFETSSSLPPLVLDVLSWNRERLSMYMLSAHLNPYYLQADFDGDGRADTAILVKERTTGKSGILIVEGTGKGFTVLGAGQPLGNGGDDFSWMDAWYVYPRARVQRGADGSNPPALRGDALMVMKTEAASALVYWNGMEYAWYQQGD